MSDNSAQIINNLKMKVLTDQHEIPVLTTINEKVYRYRFVHELRVQRLSLSDVETYGEEYDIPYEFIIATLKYFVINIVDLHSEEPKAGRYDQVLLLAQSKQRDYAIAVMVKLNDFLVLVLSAKRISASEFSSKRLGAYALERKLFFTDLDLDAYLKESKEKKKERRRRIAKAYPSFWENNDGLHYRLKCTKHLKEERSNTSGERLTIPIEAVKDILRYAMNHASSELQEYIGKSIKEKQLVLIFPSLDKSYNVGILIAINDVLVTVISMYDVSPRDKGLNTVIFPSVPRMVMPKYDLSEFMDNYHKAESEKRVLQKKLLELELRKAREEGGRIQKVTSLDEYDSSIEKRIRTVPKESVSQSFKKIVIVDKKERISEEKNFHKIILKDHNNSKLLGLGAQIMKKESKNKRMRYKKK